jgi:DNA-directed RNA polymerase specialized sigma24 family protein
MEHHLHDGEEGLTAFEILLRKLDSQRDRAAEKYEDLRHKLVKFFEWSSCFPADDLADETLDRLGRILLDRPVLDLETFIWGVAKKIRQENHKRTERVVAITDLPNQGISLKDKGDVEAEIHAIQQDEIRSKCLRLCLHRMHDQNRRVFLQYHGLYGDTKKQREELASELGLTIGALRVRIKRIRGQLEKCVQECLAFPAKKKS